MAESFLAEQLRRIRELSERLSQARNRTAELLEEIARDLEGVRQGPLHAARDLRPVTYPRPTHRRRR